MPAGREASPKARSRAAAAKAPATPMKAKQATAPSPRAPPPSAAAASPPTPASASTRASPPTPAAAAREESPPSEVAAGQRVLFTLNRQEFRGKVGFFGETHFAAGKWVGIILDTPTGKNDGSVKGEVYFQCPPNHGLFIRPQNVLRLLYEDDGHRSEAPGAPSPPEPVQTPSPARRSESPLPKHFWTPGLDQPRLDADNAKVLDLEARLRTESEACASHAGEAREAEERARENAKALRHAESAQAKDKAHGEAEIAALRRELEEMDRAHRGAAEELQVLRKEMDKVQRASEEVEENRGAELASSRDLVRRCSLMRREAQEEIKTFIEENQKLKTGVHSREASEAAAQEKERELGNVREELRKEQDARLAKLKLLEEASSALETEKAALWESEAQQRQLISDRSELLARQQALEIKLEAESLTQQTLRQELMVSNAESIAAGMEMKAEQRTFVMQAESAAVAASTRELAALKSSNEAVVELGKEIQAKYELKKEVDGLRAKLERQMSEESSLRGMLFNNLCCGRTNSSVRDEKREDKSVKRQVSLAGAQPTGGKGLAMGDTEPA